MLARFPQCTLDFFKRPLEELERRRFIHDTPRNSLRQYSPPEAFKINSSHTTRAMDHQLHEIQYRLSGLTRPIDWFVYQILANPLHNDPDAQLQRSLDFAIVVHELLSDLASHITDTRTSNLFRAANPNVRPPTLASSDNQLIDPKTFVEHINLAKSVQQATNRPKRPPPRRLPQPQSSHGSTTAPSSAPHQLRTSDPSYSSDKGQRAPSSQQKSGFQQHRPSHRKP